MSTYRSPCPVCFESGVKHCGMSVCRGMGCGEPCDECNATGYVTNPDRRKPEPHIPASVPKELAALRKLADIHHERLLKLERATIAGF